MSAKRVLKVVSALGTFRRETARDYSYIVVSKGTAEASLRARRSMQKAEHARWIEGYRAAIALASSTGLRVYKMDGTSHNELEYLRIHKLPKGSLITGTGIGYWTASEWEGFLNQTIEAEAQEAAQFEAKLEANRNEPYSVEGWTSRLDLAQKLVASVAKHSRENIAIIDVKTGEVL